MKVAFIYGPPAVGKATVAKELSSLTGFRYFINHQASDPVSAILNFEENPSLFRSISNEVKKLILERAVEMELPGLIMTFCYSKSDADHNLKNTMSLLENKGADMYFTRLYCDEEELFKRVQNPSRKGMSVKKLTEIGKLKEALRKYGFKDEIPYVKNLSIDNTYIPPQQTAEIIIKHYNFPLQQFHHNKQQR